MRKLINWLSGPIGGPLAFMVFMAIQMLVIGIVRAAQFAGPGSPFKTGLVGQINPPALPNDILRDQFTAGQAAPITTPRTADPGPGLWTVVDTGSTMPLATNRLYMRGKSTYGDPMISSSNSYARLPGRGFFAAINGTNAGTLRFGWMLMDDTSPATEKATISSFSIGSADWSPGTTYQVGVIHRGVRGYIGVISGGAFAQWTIFNAYNTVIGGTLRPCVAPFDWGGYIDDAYVQDLDGPWNSEGCFSVGSGYAAVPASPSTATGFSNGIVALNWKPLVTTETFEMSARRTDDNNKIIFRGTITNLVTVRLSNSIEFVIKSNVIGFATGTEYYVTCKLDDLSLQQLLDGAWSSPGSDSFNSTATGISFSGTANVQDFIMWPKTIAINPRPEEYHTQIKVLAYGDSRLTTGDFDPWGYGWMGILCQEGNAIDFPARVGHGGYSVSTGPGSIQFTNDLAADLTTISNTCRNAGQYPDFVVFHLAVNDSGATNAAFFANYLKMLDDFHTTLPNTKIVCSLPWSTNAAMSIWNEKAHAITNFVASRSSYCMVGPDERNMIPANFSLSYDGLHYYHIGHIAYARLVKNAIGR